MSGADINPTRTGRNEWRKEVCPDCNADREREWLVSLVSTRGTWKEISKPTRWTTLCMCDAY